MTEGTDERFRAVVTWKKLRPYYPDSYVQGAISKGYDIGRYQTDASEVGQVFETVFDNGGDFYRSARGAKQAASYHTRHHPFASIYGDGLPSTEILSTVIEKAEMVLEWRPVK